MEHVQDIKSIREELNQSEKARRKLKQEVANHVN